MKSFTLKGAYFWLMVPPLATILLGERALVFFGNNQMELPLSCCASVIDPLSESAARLQFVAVEFLYLVLTAAVIGKVSWDVWRLFGSKIPPVVSGLAIFGGTVVALIVLGVATGVLERFEEFLGNELFIRAFSTKPPLRAGGHWDLRTLELLWGANIVGTGATAAAFLIGFVTCLAEPSEDLSPDEQTKHWKQQFERLKTNVYLAAAMLALGVILFRVWALYPSFILEGAPLLAYERLVNALSAFEGIEYSLALAAMALPVAWLQSVRADHIAARTLNNGRGEAGEAMDLTRVNPTIQAAKEQLGLTLAPTEALKLLVALLAPLVTGTITSVTAAVS
jgi:hypothetical protein